MVDLLLLLLISISAIGGFVCVIGINNDAHINHKLKEIKSNAKAEHMRDIVALRFLR